ncbi:MAG: helix-turn-helix domain-containing protein [Terrimicrobiaceae bacterium]|nr:helix-turn-helix domain-containing protein [Terrimicrobiaceae bacterium]
MQTQDTSGRLALSREEAARTLGISPASVDRLTKRGLLRPSRATRRPLYPVTELVEFLNRTRPLFKSSGGSAESTGTSHGKEVNENGENL